MFEDQKPRIDEEENADVKPRKEKITITVKNYDGRGTSDFSWEAVTRMSWANQGGLKKLRSN